MKDPGKFHLPFIVVEEGLFFPTVCGENILK